MKSPLRGEIEVIAIIEGTVWARRTGSCRSMSMHGYAFEPLKALAVAALWADSDADLDEYTYDEACRHLHHDLEEYRRSRIIRFVRKMLRRLGGEFKRGEFNENG